MSVSVDVTLPAVPAGGGIQFLPLGGDGYRAPMSAYAVTFVLAGDASGGQSTITMRPDPQYVAIVSYVGSSLFSTGAAANMLLSVTNGDETATASAVLADVGVGGVNADNTALWTPPLMLLNPPQNDPFVRIVAANPGAAATHSASIRLYNFRKGVQQRTPLDVLVAALPRGSDLIAS